VLTKGVYPEDLADKKRYGAIHEYGITLVSLNDDFKSSFEPFSSPYDERIASLKRLHDAGLKTWVSMEPYPTPNLVEQDLNKLLDKISFVDKIVFGKLNYNVQTSLFKSNLFKNNAAFYEECAQIVTEFCEKRGIEYHIKFGTQKKDNKKTVNIFNKKLEPEITVKV
jgi:DNA repair photolyase